MSVLVRSTALGNLADFAIGPRTVERIHVPSDDLAKRVLRFTTSAGDVGLRYTGAERLRDGDVVFADERVVVAVSVDPDDVLVLRPHTIPAAIEIAHALGNRHLPLQLRGDAIVVRYDPLIEALAAERGVPAERAALVVAAPFRHAHAPHAHD